MPKPLQTLRVSTPERKGVFGQGGESLRAGLYARVSTHDQKTLPLQLSAMRDYAKRGTDQIAVKIQHKDRLLTDPGAIEDVLAVENDVVPFDRADVPQQPRGTI